MEYLISFHYINLQTYVNKMNKVNFALITAARSTY